MCSGFSGQPVPQITWYHEGIEISPAFERAHVKKTESESTLRIDRVRAELSGAYTVKLTSPIGIAETRCRIDLLDDPLSPRFRSALPEELEVVAGEPFVLGVHLTGQPPPEALWLKVRLLYVNVKYTACCTSIMQFLYLGDL